MDDLEAFAAVRAPAVPEFLRARSAVLVAALEDDPATSWVQALPPPSAELSPERCVELLAAMQRLLGEEHGPFRICHIRHQPLFDALAGCTITDLAQQRFLVEYLQLPKELVARIDQYAVAAKHLGTPDSSWLFETLCDNVVLAPLLVAAASQLRGLPCGFCERLTGRPDFLRGMCGDNLQLHITEQEQQLLHAAGRVAAGHPMPEGLVKLLGAHGFVCSVAAFLGRLEQLLRLEAEGWVLDDVSCAGAAAAGGNLEMIRWLAGRGRVPFEVFTYAAATHGHLHVLQWAAANGCAAPANACLEASFAGHMHVLRWLVETQPRPWDEALDVHCCRFAARRGDLPMLQLLRAHGCPWDAKTCDAAARKEHCHILAWVRGQDPPCPWNADICTAAASAGSLASLQWLRAQEPPCPWDEAACSAAAGSGALAVLQWLRAQDPPCPWNRQVIAFARRGRHPAVIEWARENGCPLAP
jgi:hypothetical protein